jgi:hypothetical protein
MPATLPGIVGVLTPNLVSTAFLGMEVPRLATAIASGLVKWIPTIVVLTVDAGTLGAGSNVPQPLTVPQPLLYGNLLAGAASSGLVGQFIPSFALGLANGLVLAFLQALIKTTHSSISTGTGVATFRASSAIPIMIESFASAGLIGDSAPRMASMIGMGLDVTFASLVIPIVIVGPTTPTGGSGAGVGNLI